MCGLCGSVAKCEKASLAKALNLSVCISSIIRLACRPLKWRRGWPSEINEAWLNRIWRLA